MDRSSTQAHGKAARILVVDEEQSSREALCKVLKTEGFEVSNQFSDDEDLAHLHEHNPDAVLLEKHGEGHPNHAANLIPGATLYDIEREAILRTLELVDGSTSRAAGILGISVRKIQYRLKEYAAANAQSAQNGSGQNGHANADS